MKNININSANKEAMAKAAIKAAYQFINEGDEIAAFVVIEALLVSEGMSSDLQTSDLQ